MKTKITILVTIIVCLGLSQTFAQPVDLPDDQAAIAILQFDYMTDTFEQGYLTPLAPITSNLLDTIPLTRTYQPPVDQGWINFAYAPANFSLFHATIVWMGTGNIATPTPDSWIVADSFEVTDEAAPDPVSFSVWENSGNNCSDDSTVQRANQVMDVAKHLEIAHNFAEGNGYHGGIYFYSPSVGTETPTPPSKSIVFLYRGSRVTGVKFSESGFPGDFKLYPAYPNPFNPSTMIQFELPQNEHVRLTIYDISGRAIRTLTNAPLTASHYEVIWNGKNDQGQHVSTGIYFARMEARSFSKTIKMMYLK